MATSRRRKGAENDRVDADKILRDQSKMMGETCNKYKSRQRAITPGPFTVFCRGCGVCEAFEMMPIAESPLTAFRMFAHRAWRTDDHEVLRHFEEDGIWNDCI